MKRSGALRRRTPLGGRSPKGRLTRIDWERAVQLHDKGLSQVEIAKEIDCHSATLSRGLRKRGRPAHSQSELTGGTVDIEEAVRRYEAGEGYVPIARYFGVTPARLRDLLVEAGTTIRGPGKIPGTPGKKGPRPALRGRRSGSSYNWEFRAVMEDVATRSGGHCESRMSPRCSGWATHGHHRKLRSQGGKNDLATLLHVCIFCHMWIHRHVEDSYTLGQLVRCCDDPADIAVVIPDPHYHFHCHKGHELTESNRYVNPRGAWLCRTCRREERALRRVNR